MAISKNTARKNILDRLTGFTQFHPVSTDLFTDWTVEPGDVIKVQNDGVTYDVPIYQMDIDWKGTPTIDIQSTGSKKRPDPSKLSKGSGYGGSRKKEEEEIVMVRHQADITKTNEKISLWATEEEWSAIADEYQEIHRTQFDLTAEGLTSTVTGVAGGNFDKTQAYAVGDVVMRNGKVYVFTSPHVANTDWNYSEVAEALNLYGSIKSHSTRITQTENAVGLVVYNGEIRAGQIMLAINGGTGHSEALIEANKVQIIGNTTIGDTMTYANSNLYVKGDIYAMTPGGSYHALAGNMVVPSGCALYFNNGSSGNVTVNATNMEQMLDSVMNVRIVETSSGSGVYRLEYKNIGDTNWTPDTTTFSRAATQPTIGGSWSGGVYTITSDVTPASGSVMTTTLWTDISPGQPTVSGNTVSVTYDIGWQEEYEGQMIRGGSTGRTGTISIDMSLGTRSSTQPSDKTQLWSTLTTNGYYPVASNGYIRVNVSTSHSINASVKSGTYATRADMEAAYPNHSWSSLGSVSTGYRAVEITCGSTSKWFFYVGT